MDDTTTTTGLISAHEYAKLDAQKQGLLWLKASTRGGVCDATTLARRVIEFVHISNFETGGAVRLMDLNRRFASLAKSYGTTLGELLAESHEALNTSCVGRNTVVFSRAALADYVEIWRADMQADGFKSEKIEESIPAMIQEFKARALKNL